MINTTSIRKEYKNEASIQESLWMKIKLAIKSRDTFPIILTWVKYQLQ